MKKSVRTLALLMALCFVLSLGAFASGEPSGAAFAQVDDTHWAGSEVTIQSVEYAPEFTDQGYVDSTLFTSVSKIVYDGGEIAVDNTVYTPILTVDGVQRDLYNAENVTYTGDVQITLAEKGDSSTNNGAPFGADKAQSSFGPFYYTAAAYVGAEGYDEAKSVSAAQIQGEVTNTEANGLVVDSQGDYFTAVYVKDAEYAINDADINLIGHGGDDFNGWGAGVVALGSAVVDINRSYIYGTGVLRSGVFASGTAVVNVNDSVIITENDPDEIPYDTEDNYATPMMQQCPFGLGITGNIRATISCGSGCNNFTNSLVVSDGWAVLSTDSGRSGATALVSNAMVAVVGQASKEEIPTADFTYDVNGETWHVDVGEYGEESGYIAYADAGVLDYAYGSAWYSPDYLGIITTGTITMADNCYGYAGRIGFMSHSGSGSSGHGSLYVSDSSFDIQNIFAVTMTSGTYYTTTVLDNVDVALAGNGAGMLYLQTNSDDNGGGPGSTSNTVIDLTYDEYLAQAAAEAGAASELSISNSIVQGDIYNAATDDAVGLNVVLDAAEVQGNISSAWAYHVDAEGNALDTTEINLDYYTGTIDGSSGTYDYTMFLRLDAEAAPTVNNPVNVTMQNGSTWMITGSNYLTSLTIDETSTIKGMGLVMTVDGVETEIAAGTYTGEIVLTAGEAPARAESDAVPAAPVIGDAAEIEAAESAATETAFESGITFEPFNVDVGDGMILEFSGVELAVTDATAAIFIPDTSKLIECVITDGQWIMEGSDFVDDAIIAAAKALYEANASAEVCVHEPFNVDVGDGMILEFSSVELTLGDGTVTIFIPDSSKQIDCVITDGQWIMEGSDFVDDAIIATAKALHEAEEGAAPAAGSKWDSWIAYLKGLIDSNIADIADQVAGELDAAQESDYAGMNDGTVFGVFAFMYEATPYEEWQG